MSKLKRQLTLVDGIALGIGSIMGSGILFLPSLTYKIAGTDVLGAWCLTTLLCLPLIVLFSDMIKAVPTEHGVSGFLRLGLGKHVAAGLPILLLGTVAIGMPSAAIIASRYVSRYINGGIGTEAAMTGFLIVASIAANTFGLKIGARVQRTVAGLLFVMGCSLFFLGQGQSVASPESFQPAWDIQKILTASVVSFWAYAGFENMTFMAGEFKNPKRDLVLSIIISLFCCGLLYIGLTFNTASLIPHSQVNGVLGLYQLAESGQKTSVLLPGVVLFAVVAVLINLVSWSWGLSRMIYAASADGHLPTYFNVLSKDNVPRRALMLLGGLLTFMSGLLLFEPSLLDKGLQLVSCNFVFIYLLCSASYTVYSKNILKKILGLALTAALTCGLSSSGWMVLYPISLIAVAGIRSKLIQNRRLK